MSNTYLSCSMLYSFLGTIAIAGCTKPATSDSETEPKGSSPMKISIPEPDLSASIEGRVWRGLDVSLVGGRTSEEYVVEITIKNLGPSPLQFDACNARFVPSKFGQPVDGAKPLDSRLTAAQELFWALKPQEEKKFTFRTDGYTRELLSSAKEGNLYFQVTLERNGKALGAPRTTPLPPLEDCPQKNAGKEQKGVQVILQGRPTAQSDRNKENYDNSFVRDVLALPTEDERVQFVAKHDGQTVGLSGTIVEVRGTARVFCVVETEQTKSAGARGFDIAVAPSEKETVGLDLK